MAKVIQLPNGEHLGFPDDMHDDDIKPIVDGYWQKQSESTPAQKAAKFYQDNLESGGDPADIEASLVKGGIDPSVIPLIKQGAQGKIDQKGYDDTTASEQKKMADIKQKLTLGTGLANGFVGAIPDTIRGIGFDLPLWAGQKLGDLGKLTGALDDKPDMLDRLGQSAAQVPHVGQLMDEAESKLSGGLNQATTPEERFGKGALEMIGGIAAPAGLATNSLGALGRVAKFLTPSTTKELAGAAGATLAGAGVQATDPNDPLAQIAATLTGGIIGHKVPGVVKDVATLANPETQAKLLGSLARTTADQVDPNVVQAGQDLNINLPADAQIKNNWLIDALSALGGKKRIASANEQIERSNPQISMNYEDVGTRLQKAAQDLMAQKSQAAIASSETGKIDAQDLVNADLYKSSVIDPLENTVQSNVQDTIASNASAPEMGAPLQDTANAVIDAQRAENQANYGKIGSMVNSLSPEAAMVSDEHLSPILRAAEKLASHNEGAENIGILSDDTQKVRGAGQGIIDRLRPKEAPLPPELQALKDNGYPPELIKSVAEKLGLTPPESQPITVSDLLAAKKEANAQGVWGDAPTKDVRSLVNNLSGATDAALKNWAEADPANRMPIYNKLQDTNASYAAQREAQAPGVVKNTLMSQAPSEIIRNINSSSDLENISKFLMQDKTGQAAGVLDNVKKAILNRELGVGADKGVNDLLTKLAPGSEKADLIRAAAGDKDYMALRNYAAMVKNARNAGDIAPELGSGIIKTIIQKDPSDLVKAIKSPTDFSFVKKTLSNNPNIIEDVKSAKIQHIMESGAAKLGQADFDMLKAIDPATAVRAQKLQTITNALSNLKSGSDLVKSAAKTIKSHPVTTLGVGLVSLLHPASIAEIGAAGGVGWLGSRMLSNDAVVDALVRNAQAKTPQAIALSNKNLAVQLKRVGGQSLVNAAHAASEDQGE